MAQHGDSTPKTGITMKLLIDSKSNKVVFAEAGKDMVDFLFTLLSLPLATVVGLLGKQSVTGGAIRKLFESAENIDNSVIISNSLASAEQVKKDLLNPSLPSKVAGGILQLPWRTAGGGVVAPPPPTAFYSCANYPNHSYVTSDLHTPCPRCQYKMIRPLEFVPPSSVGKVGRGAVFNQVSEAERGFVKGGVTYTITDDLTITPLSTISALTLVRRCNVYDLSAMEEKTVTVGIKEGKEILKASLHSTTVLSDVFVAKETVNSSGNRKRKKS